MDIWLKKSFLNLWGVVVCASLACGVNHQKVDAAAQR